MHNTNMCSIVLDPPAPLAEERPLDQLEREICELAAHIAAATCRWLLLIAEFDRREGWGQWGSLTCAHWLSWRCGIGIRAAREHVRVARALEGLPLVRAAFATGELTYTKARALTRVAIAETEADLVTIARHATGAQLDKLALSYTRAIRVSEQDLEEQEQQQRLAVNWQADGSFAIHGRLTAENGALLLAALEAIETPDELANAGADQRQAAALVALARGEAKPCEVVVHVDADSLTGERIKERCEVQDGPGLAPETARRLGCDGSVVRIIERDGKPLSVGRRTRVISPALRRPLRTRDQGACRFPGCTHKQWLHAHHIRHWARGGPTDLTNLVQLCSHHHKLVHEGGYGVALDEAGQISFHRPDGTVIPEQCAGEPTRGPSLIAQNEERRLAIDDHTCFPKSAGDRLDYHHAVFCLMQERQRGAPGDSS
jgi:hypothetical protein